ncbi:unnamed protein product [Soboliphyme baturini]|uniref:AMP-binding domain-containing protein n=1 Tax=Soboliphyme baturini TaxID=241478 RepID=A0A183J375_9BILA|nr:unnamed protein product [Soboliphyme baturini]
MIKEKVAKRYDLSSIRHVLVGSAPISPEQCKEFVANFPNVCTFSEGYGLTETCGASHRTPPLPVNHPKIGSCGQLMPYFECKVVDLDTGEELGPYKRGEIHLKGPMICLGYYKNAAASAELIDRDGWLHSDCITFNHLVSPSELEAVLLRNSKVLEAAVIGVPDTTCGECPFACIVRKDPSLTAEEICIYLNELVAPFKRIKEDHVHFIESLPKNKLEKIQRKVLRRMYDEGRLRSIPKSKI